MKKILLITCLIFCCKLITAQESSNYQFFITFIDSLKTEYSVKKFINSVMVDLPRHYRKPYSELSEEEQNKVWNYVSTLYNQTEYLGLYGLAGVLLDGYYSYSKDNVKKRMIEINFDKISYMSSEVIDFGESKYYSQHAKDRLLEIAEKQWSEDDIKAWTVFIKQSLNIDSYKKDVQKIMENADMDSEETANYLLDSLIQKGIAKNLQTNINRPIYKRCIMMIGSLGDQRFVPALENMLEEYKDHKDYPQIQQACTYALAKLGVQKYIDEIFENDKDIHYRYLGTKEAFLRWLEINRDWKQSDRLCTSCGYLPLPLISLYKSQKYVQNEIPKELKISILDIEYFCLPGKDNCDSVNIENSKLTVQKVEKLYQWFINNKDSLKLPPAHDSF
jgi:hypothetical protein